MPVRTEMGSGVSSGTQAATAASGQPGRPRTAWDFSIASTLLDLEGQLGALTYAAYLPLAGRPALGVALAVDTPCGFTIPSELDLEDMRLPTVRAYRTGDLVVVEAAELRELTRQVPAFFLHNPFPLAVASVPLIAGGRTFGCLSIHWSRTRAPETPIAANELNILRSAAQELSDQLLSLASTETSIRAPSIPIFVPPIPAELTTTVSALPADQLGWGVTGSAFLYQLKRLSTQLAAAVQIRDVLTAAQTHIMAPFGASALMLCRAREGRLHVVGSSGFSRDEIARLDSTPLSRSTPETDTVTLVEAQLPRLGDTRMDSDAGVGQRPRAYMPLIANGRCIGCCVLEFPVQWRRFPTDEEIALAGLM
ncbi:GAF domain-containing protein, partial [Streptomyces sp. NPDC058964]